MFSFSLYLAHVKVFTLEAAVPVIEEEEEEEEEEEDGQTTWCSVFTNSLLHHTPSTEEQAQS